MSPSQPSLVQCPVGPLLSMHPSPKELCGPGCQMSGVGCAVILGTLCRRSWQPDCLVRLKAYRLQVVAAASLRRASSLPLPDISTCTHLTLSYPVLPSQVNTSDENSCSGARAATLHRADNG